MSDRIPPAEQGRWHERGRRGTRGPNRVPRHPTMRLPDEVPVAEEIEEDDEMSPQKDPSGGSGGIGGPKSPPAGPKTPPPPNPPPSE